MLALKLLLRDKGINFQIIICWVWLFMKIVR